MDNVFDLGAELEKVVKQDAMPVNGAVKAQIKTIDPETAVERLGGDWDLITLESIFTGKIEENPIAKGFLNEDEQTIIFAPGGTGKSLLVQDTSMALACNFERLWGKFEIPKPRTSLFIQSENGRLPVYQRVSMKCEGNPDYIVGLQNIIFAGRHNSIQVAGHVSDQQFRDDLIEFAKRATQELEAKIDIVVWDPLISYHDAEENDNSRMRTTLDHISEVSNDIGATPIVIHHANKEGGIRGASAIFDWARNIIKLEDASYKGEKRIKLTHEKCNNAKMFDPFILAMDEYLNFTPIEITETLPKGQRERCLKVKEALELLSGDTKNKAELVKQYKELTGLGSVPTIHRHIDQAVDNEFINRDYYMDGKLKKAEYYIGVKPYVF